ncbi:MAG TPA: protein kinase [Bryobacteraceae bacterium]|nr:protein kinase [Bryobacteraceae bacterium]
MNPERWRQVERLYHAALERELGKRAAFLAEACSQDDQLRREVESLLAQHASGDGPLDHPAAGLLSNSLATRLAPGSQLGPYRIDRILGAGGMGEVYRARDTRLGRDVAIKISKEQFSERFEREARAIAALNHPNICQLYDVGPNYLVMELIGGESLKGPLPLDAALDYARQIAEALEAAHEKGITHRDLKPANIKITPQGVVKVLDFGLASVAQAASASGDAANSPTLTMSPTIAGMILGTAAYMSPEQARGKPVDRRADIWAFGVVLYEMLTGEQLFRGETITDILAAVVKEEPDLARVPAKIRRLLRSCLEKDPKQRLQAIGDSRLLLEGSPQTAAAPASRKWLWPSVATLLLAALCVVSFTHFREKPPSPPEPLRFQIPTPERGSFGDGLALSPDGRRLAFSANGPDGRSQLWVRNLDTLESRPLSGTDGATGQFWSPDNRFLAFGDGTRLKKIDLSGGPAITLCELPQPVGSGSWSAAGVLLVGGRGTGPLWRVSASGGLASQVTKLDSARQEMFHTFGSFLPDARHFIYLRRSNTAENNGIYLGSLDAKPEDQAVKRLLATQFGALYAPSSNPLTGHILFLREGTLLSQVFDAKRLELVGDPVPVAEQVGNVNGVAGYFTASSTALAYRAGGGGGGVQLTWFDRQGKALGTVGEPGILQRPSISPDGRTVAIDRRDPQTGYLDIWLHDLARGSASRFTFNSNNTGYPIWSPDSSHIAFYTSRNVRSSVEQKSTSGVGQNEVLDAARPARPVDWSRDGRYIIESSLDPKTKADVWVLPLFGDRKPFPYLQTEFNELDAKLSPNGQWLAYVSDETRRNEVYVQTFPNPGGKWQISTTGGTLPVWSRDGKELFFIGTAIGATRKMMAVDVKVGAGTGAKFEAGVPKALFDTHLDGAFSPGFDVSKDGRFLIPTQQGANSSSPITVVVNWNSGLK